MSFSLPLIIACILIIFALIIFPLIISYKSEKDHKLNEWDKIKEYEDKALTTIPDEDVRWMPGGKRKKSNKRKTRNKKKGGGNSISLFKELKSLDELKSHLDNNIKVPTGSRSDPGKHNIDAVTRANNKTRNKENKSIHRKSLKKFNKRNNR